MDQAGANLLGFGMTARRVRVIAALSFLGLVVAIASIGGPATPVQAAATAFGWILLGGIPATIYIVSGIGLGRLALPLFRTVRERWAIQAAVGLSIQLSVGHAINYAGAFLPGIAWNFASLVPCLIGLVLIFGQIRVRLELAQDTVEDRWDGRWLFAMLVCGLPLAVMLVAACAPPGWLWASEFGGFDALSYHLQLPREWLELGRLRPVTHNVYSFLPSYFESAFLTLQLWTFAPKATSDGVSGMLASDGWRLLACQMLHVGFGVVAAWLVGAGVRELEGRIGSDQNKDRPTPIHLPSGGGSGIAAAAFLCVPWVVVTGSLAYDELAMCSLFAGALVVALSDGLNAWWRAVLCGWLVGVACGVKPTALFFVSPVVGLALVWGLPGREWIRIVLGAAVGGFAALLPWMLRNYLASGNPVFPYAHGVFGDAHWTAEQYARFAGAHRFDGTWADRLRLLFVQDESDPAGARHRGLFHWQWSIFFPLVAVAGIVGLIAQRTRGVAGLLLVGLLMQIAAWLALTHLQSRFLLPLAVPGAMLIGAIGSGVWMGAARNSETVRSIRVRGIVQTLAMLAIAFMGVRSLDNFWTQRGGRPNGLLAAGPGVLINSELRDGKGGLKNGEVVYLLGDSTPLYVPGPLVYHTTWDASPLGDAVRAAPGPAAEKANEWSRLLRERGIQAVFINPSEIDRLSGTKWYDLAVTLPLVRDWVTFGTKPVRMFEDSGHLLVRPNGGEGKKQE